MTKAQKSIKDLAPVLLLILAGFEVLHASCLPTAPGSIEAARGRIVNFSGHPVASAQIQFFSATPSRRRKGVWIKSALALLTVSTDSEGDFDFSTIRPGTYYLEVKTSAMHRTLLAAFAPRNADPLHEIKLRLTGVECNGFEVTAQ
ncbi:MAG: carboxypeptidase-like regulatory domain-containing protein [Candidatus Acidiferrales bacterium]